MKKIALNTQDIRTAVKTIKTAILKSRYMAARKANVEHLKLYFRVGRMCPPIHVMERGERVPLRQFRKSCHLSCRDCVDSRRLT